MSINRFPSLGELDLDPALRLSIMSKGGKAGVLDWISRVSPQVPIIENILYPDPTLARLKSVAKRNKCSLLVRSNNPCEYLPGTEGLFNTVCVDDYDGRSDDILFKFLFDLPKAPSSHLEKDWPKKQKDMRYAVAPNISGAYQCTVLEHPNRPGVFWGTIIDRERGSFKYTFSSVHSEVLDPRIDSDRLEFEEFGGDRGLARMLETARTVSQIDGLDPRYSKQMEFLLKGENHYLVQVKILRPKEIATAPRIKVNGIKLMMPWGVFNEEVTLVHDRSPVVDGRIAMVFESPDISEKKGQGYSSNMAVVFFERSGGLFNHGDIPHFLYANGVGLARHHSTYLLTEGSGSPVYLGRFMNKKVRLRSDGNNIFIRPLE